MKAQVGLTIRPMILIAALASVAAAQQRDSLSRPKNLKTPDLNRTAAKQPIRGRVSSAIQLQSVVTEQYADSLRKQRFSDSLRVVDSVRRSRVRDSIALAATFRRRHIMDSLRLDSIRRDDSLRLLSRPPTTAVQQPPVRITSTDSVRIRELPTTIRPNSRIGVPVAMSRGIRDSVAKGGSLLFTFDSISVLADSVSGDVAYFAVPASLKGGKSYAVSVLWGTERSAATVVGIQRSLWQQVTFGTFILLVVLAIVAKELTSRRARTQQQKELERVAAEQQEQAARADRQRKDALQEVGRLRYEAELGPSSLGSSRENTAPSPALSFPQVPEVPRELVEACAAGACVLFASSGLGAQAGLPTTRILLSRLLEQATATEDDQKRRELVQALNDGKYAVVADLISTRLTRDQILSAARDMYARDVEALPEIHTRLGNIPFCSAVSYSWDDLLERAFTERDPYVVFPTRDAPAERLTSDNFRILKPFGSLAEPDTFLFTTAESNRAARANRSFNRVLGSLVLSNPWFFVGAGARTVDEFLANLPERLDRARRHYALVPREADWSIQEELFREKYGVQLIGFTPTQDFPEVLEFVRKLEEQVQQVRPHVQQSEITAATLGHVTLRNIGAFEALELDFNPKWNVLLGNNGSGKSTILRAIALGVCGDDEDAAKAARHLLREGATSGFVQLTVGNVKYRTDIHREGKRVRVESLTATALQKGKWVVLGFPPLRGVSMKNPDGPGGEAGSRVPVVEDLLPLIRGSFDSRMDDLKQWIVNVHARSNSKDASEAVRSLALRKSFFAVLKRLTPGAFVDFDTVYTDTWEVRVSTADGSIPIDQVSQGMSSILGWVGTMLQRMYEIHRNAAEPEMEPALVLVDELEAHLHPEWQQRIVGLIRECFPKLQIIATSHSPLLVAGMKASEVIIARRSLEDPKKILVEQAPVEFEGMRADQVLTSPAFGLMSTRGEQVAVDLKRYNDLRQMKERGKDAEAELATLRTKLDKALQPPENEARKKVLEAVSITLRRMADPSSPVVEDDTGRLKPDIRYELKKRLDEILPVETKEERVT